MAEKAQMGTSTCSQQNDLYVATLGCVCFCNIQAETFRGACSQQNTLRQRSPIVRGMVVDHCDRHPRFFQNVDGRPYFRKCGLVSTRHISETIQDHIVPHALGMVRKLTSTELKEYVGGRKVMLDHQIFWKTLPEWSKGRPVYQVTPPHRLRSKTSIAVE